MISHAAQRLKSRFTIETIIENGSIHYKVTDKESGQSQHCDCGEISETIEDMLDEEK